MNCDKKSNGKHSIFKVKYWIVFTFLPIVLSFIACNKDDGEENLSPSLKVINQSNDHWPITSVTLVGYEFKNLNIYMGDYQMFALDEGMPGGNNDISITVRYGPPGSLWFSSTEVDFSKGEPTIITLKGCISYSECSGFYLE